MIPFDSIHKSYTSEVSTGPIDLEIPTDAIMALISPNDTDKSTLLTMIDCPPAVGSGGVNVGPYNVGKTKSKDLAKVLSILR